MNYLRIGIVAAIIAVIGLGILSIKDVYHERNQLRLDKSKLEGKNEILTTSLDHVQKAHNIDNTVQDKNQKDLEALHNRLDQMDQNTNAKIQSIQHHYQQLPNTPSNNNARDNDIQLAAMSGVWSTYCAAGNQDPSCPAKGV